MSQGVGKRRVKRGKCCSRSTLGNRYALKQVQKSLQGPIGERDLAELRYAVERDHLSSEAWFGCDLGPQPLWRHEPRRLLWVVKPDRDRVEHAGAGQVVDQRVTTAVDRHL